MDGRRTFETSCHGFLDVAGITAMVMIQSQECVQRYISCPTSPVGSRRWRLNRHASEARRAVQVI